MFNRRKALQYMAAGAGLLMPARTNAEARQFYLTDTERGSFSIDGVKLKFYHPQIRQKQSLLMIADTHLFKDDARGIRFQEYSGRMAKAYNQTNHFLSGADTNPESCFIGSLSRAKEIGCQYIALIGDIVSFPSEAAVEWTVSELHKAGIPYLYTAGNHDWHYEGMKGSSAALREQWCRERLSPLYHGMHLLYHKQSLGEIDLLLIDNSTYEIHRDQLDFFLQQEKNKRPTLLMMHIPLYIPGRPLGFGCGHPEWNGKNDRSWQLERREPWRTEGHTQITMDFHRAVFKSKNIIGILAGHIHRPSVDIFNGIPQIVTEANARGAHLEIELMPMA